MPPQHNVQSEDYEKLSDKGEAGKFPVVRFPRRTIRIQAQVVDPKTRCSRDVLSVGIVHNDRGRKIRDTEEYLEVFIEVFINDVYFVREDIVLGPFPAHLDGTRLGGTRFTDHLAIMYKPSTS